MLPLSVFVFLWASDSGAYCFGSLFGRHKLFPRISPNKSWEGSVGGGLVAVAASQIFACFEPSLDRWEWLGLALTVVIFGTWGDLVESLLKRQLQIKDSGNILPGHGWDARPFRQFVAGHSGFCHLPLHPYLIIIRRKATRLMAIPDTRSGNHSLEATVSALSLSIQVCLNDNYRKGLSVPRHVLTDEA